MMSGHELESVFNSSCTQLSNAAGDWSFEGVEDVQALTSREK